MSLARVKRRLTPQNSHRPIHRNIFYGKPLSNRSIRVKARLVSGAAAAAAACCTELTAPSSLCAAHSIQMKRSSTISALFWQRAVANPTFSIGSFSGVCHATWLLCSALGWTGLGCSPPSLPPRRRAAPAARTQPQSSIVPLFFLPLEAGQIYPLGDHCLLLPEWRKSLYI